MGLYRIWLTQGAVNSIDDSGQPLLVQEKKPLSFGAKRQKGRFCFVFYAQYLIETFVNCKY